MASLEDLLRLALALDDVALDLRADIGIVGLAECARFARNLKTRAGVPTAPTLFLGLPFHRTKGSSRISRPGRPLPRELPLLQAGVAHNVCTLFGPSAHVRVAPARAIGATHAPGPPQSRTRKSVVATVKQQKTRNPCFRTPDSEALESRKKIVAAMLVCGCTLTYRWTSVTSKLPRRL